MNRWDYQPWMTDEDREHLDQQAAEYGMDERDGRHEEHEPELAPYPP